MDTGHSMTLEELTALGLDLEVRIRLSAAVSICQNHLLECHYLDPP